MPRIPVFKLRSRGPIGPPPQLVGHVAVLPLTGIPPGIDNLRSDVCLSPRFCEQMRTHLGRLIVRYGGVETVLDEHNASPVEEKQAREMFVRPVTSASSAANATLQGNGANDGKAGPKAFRQGSSAVKRVAVVMYLFRFPGVKGT